MKPSLRPFFHLGLAAGLLLVGLSSHATQRLPAQDEVNDGTIEIIYPAEPTADYKERRSNWSTTFGIGVDNVLPDKYRSRVGGQTFKDFFGSTAIPMFQIEFGTKYNFAMGGIGMGLFYGRGETQGKNVDDTVTLSLQKKGINFTYSMDNLFNEPVVVPYFSGQVFNLDFNQQGTGIDDSGSTAITTGYTVGAMFQLNWLDPDSALKAQNSVGLENSYLDVFLSQYNTSDSEGDPNFQTAFNWGAGLRLEF